jgi:ABC-2 type transport system ATP-binding protein
MELVIEGLTKRYGRRGVLDDINLRMGSGVLGLLGNNGAGKTTLMRIIATRLRQTQGTVSWNNWTTHHQPNEIRAVLGYLPQDFGLYPEMTPHHFLSYIARLKGLPTVNVARRVGEVLEMVGLSAEAQRPMGGFSGGMRQRIGIAQALLNDPQLLIVDEPTAGLDPEQRIHFRVLLSTLTTNRLVILSTHIIGDLEATATRLALIKGGRIVTNTTPQELLTASRERVWELTVDPATATTLQARYKASRVLSGPQGVLLRLLAAGQPHPAARPVEPTLEDACLLALGEQPATLN